MVTETSPGLNWAEIPHSNEEVNTPKGQGSAWEQLVDGLRDKDLYFRVHVFVVWQNECVSVSP